MAKKNLTIIHVSNSTGSTARRVSTGALMRFETEGYTVKTRLCANVTTLEDVKRVFAGKLPRGKKVLVFTMVNPEIQRALVEEAQARGIALIDVMQPMVQQLGGFLDAAQDALPGPAPLLTEDGDTPYEVAEAIRFTMLHDDGMNPETHDEADLIIFGVSRTGKTPTSVYLSTHNLKVANVPIVLPEDLPDRALNELARRVNGLGARKVGFTIDERRLQAMRRARSKSTGLGGEYCDMNRIIEELEYASRLYRKIASCLVIDVTDRSIEETSAWIMRSINPD